MKSVKQLLMLVLLAAVVLALPVTVLANKQVFRATLTTDAELHEVIDSNARGAAIVGTTPQGIHFEVSVNGLSGAATAAHIHGPATPEQNASPVVTLCGNPQPAVLAECTMENGALKIRGMITTQLVGMTPAQFLAALQSGNLYVNVHTQLNPAGEARGQLYPR